MLVLLTPLVFLGPYLLTYLGHQTWTLNAWWLSSSCSPSIILAAGKLSYTGRLERKELQRSSSKFPTEGIILKVLVFLCAKHMLGTSHHNKNINSEHIAHTTCQLLFQEFYTYELIYSLPQISGIGNITSILQARKRRHRN